MLAITTILDLLTTAVLFFVDCKGCLLVLPWPLLSPRAALALVIAQAGSAIGAVVVDGPVANIQPARPSIDEGGYEVIPHLPRKPFIWPCCAEQQARDAASAHFLFN